MNLDALWHDLECGDYREDLPYWRELAAETGGPVLDIGAGTGRVTLDLAAAGVEWSRLDIEPALLAALSHRASVETVVADACTFELDRRFGLIVAPMQTLQLLADRTRLPPPRARAPAAGRPAGGCDLRRDGLLRREHDSRRRRRRSRSALRATPRNCSPSSRKAVAPRSTAAA